MSLAWRSCRRTLPHGIQIISVKAKGEVRFDLIVEQQIQECFVNVRSQQLSSALSNYHLLFLISFKTFVRYAPMKNRNDAGELHCAKAMNHFALNRLDASAHQNNHERRDGMHKK